MNAGEEYSQLDIINVRFQKMKCFTTLVQNALFNCSNILLQSITTDLCNEGHLHAEGVFGSVICSFSAASERVRASILFPIARWLRSELPASLLEGELVLYFVCILLPGSLLYGRNKNGEHEQSSEISHYFPIDPVW